jgi:hypothetical protein
MILHPPLSAGIQKIKFWYLLFDTCSYMCVYFFLLLLPTKASASSLTPCLCSSWSHLQLLCLLRRLRFWPSSTTASPYIFVIILEHCSAFRFLTPVRVLHFWCGIRALTCRKQFKLFPALPNPEPQFKHACASANMQCSLSLGSLGGTRDLTWISAPHPRRGACDDHEH